MPPQNMKLPIRSDGLTMITTGYEPVVRDRATGEVVTDQANGQPANGVYVTVPLPDEAGKIPDEPVGTEPSRTVVTEDLVATEHNNGRRHGIGARPKAVVPADASALSGSREA